MRSLCSILVLSAFLVGPSGAADPRNIILIMSADMGWSDLGCYGWRDPDARVGWARRQRTPLNGGCAEERLTGISKLERFAERGERRSEPVPLFDQRCQRLPRAVFTVGKDNSGFGLSDAVEPSQQFGLSGMGAKPAHRVHFGLHGDGFPMNLDLGHPFDQQAAEHVLDSPR